MSENAPLVMQATAVSIGGKALILEGPPGSGKSSLALALIDRGAELIGDDGVTLERKKSQIVASPPPNIAGLIEMRGIGLISIPVTASIPVSLILTLGEAGERLPAGSVTRDVMGLAIPVLSFVPGAIAPAIRAEMALIHHGI